MLFKNFDIINSNLNNNLSLVIVAIIIISTLTFLINKICIKYQILDFPNKRKDHKFPIPVSGGIILIVSNFIFYLISEYIIQNNSNFLLNLILISTIFFLLGIFDDIKNFNTNYKIITILLIILVFLIIYDDLVISELRFKYLLDQVISLKYMSIPFTLFCIFMFFNALNYSDGKNGISISYCLFFVIFLSIIDIENNFFFHQLIITLAILLIFNIRDKLFLGNNGVNFLSIFLSLLIIKIYNVDKNNIYCDEIFLLMLIPGIDASRVTLQRIYKNISPLKPDRRHLHHYMSSFLKENFIWIFYLLLSSLPIILLNITKNFYFALFLPVFFYVLIILKFSKN